MKVDIYFIDGFCPVQSEGKFGDHYYYFRARGESWSIIVGVDEKTLLTKYKWRYSEDWPHGSFSAGYMSEEDARNCINRAAKLFEERLKNENR